MTQGESQRQEILQLLADQKITAAEAVGLLTDVKPNKITDIFEEISPSKAPGNKSEPVQKSAITSGTANLAAPTWFHVRVSDLKSGRDKVTVNIPLRLVKFGLSLGRHFAPELDDINLDELSGEFFAQQGSLIDVRDEEDGEHVQIYID